MTMAFVSRGKTIVVIEDDEAIRELLRTILDEAGYSVVTFSDGNAALAHLDAAPVDLVLLDLMMPRPNGWQITQALQAHPEHRRIPIIVLSAMGDGAPAGVAAVLMKPCPIDDVVLAVERALHAERRHTRRYPARLGVTTTSHAGAQRTTTRDISVGGMAFDVPAPLSVGDRVSATIDLRGDGVAEVELEIRHVAARGGAWHVGARFLAFHQNAAGFAAALARVAEPPLS